LLQSKPELLDVDELELLEVADVDELLDVDELELLEVADVDELLDVEELLEVADVDELLELLVAVLELVPPPTVPLDIHDSVPSGPNKNSP